jgi:hypothetical protein
MVRVVEVFEMKSPEVKLPVIAFNTVLYAHGKLGNWQTAMKVFL